MNVWVHPRVINTDKAPTYRAAMAALKEEDTCPPTTLRTIQFGFTYKFC